MSLEDLDESIWKFPVYEFSTMIDNKDNAFRS